MGESIAASIEIGGTLLRADVDEFLETLAAQGVCPEWGEAPTWDESNLPQGTPLQAHDSEASWGTFETLEYWCREHNLSYKRTADAKYEYDGEVVWWQPGMEEPKTVTADQSGNEVIPVRKLRQLKNFHALQRLLRTHTAPDVPPLVVVEA